MATITAQHEIVHSDTPKASFGAWASLGLFTLLPLAAFSGANFAADAIGTMPLFFSPAGLPGWAGAAIHLVMLASIGLALGLTYAKGVHGRKILPWGVALVLAMVIFPYFAPQLDSFALALVMTSVLLLGMATSIRVARVSSAAGWVMLPSLLWLGFGAALGLAVAAAWSPPFALTNAQSSAAPTT
jgi:tryptophan-rich sensory protein